MPVEFTTTDSTSMGVAVSDMDEPGELEPMPRGTPDTTSVPQDGFTSGPVVDPTAPMLIGSSQEPVEVIVVDPGRI